MASRKGLPIDCNGVSHAFVIWHVSEPKQRFPGQWTRRRGSPYFLSGIIRQPPSARAPAPFTRDRAQPPSRRHWRISAIDNSALHSYARHEQAERQPCLFTQGGPLALGALCRAAAVERRRPLRVRKRLVRLLVLPVLPPASPKQDFSATRPWLHTCEWADLQRGSQCAGGMAPNSRRARRANPREAGRQEEAARRGSGVAQHTGGGSTQPTLGRKRKRKRKARELCVCAPRLVVAPVAVRIEVLAPEPVLGGKEERKLRKQK